MAGWVCCRSNRLAPRTGLQRPDRGGWSAGTCPGAAAEDAAEDKKPANEASRGERRRRTRAPLLARRTPTAGPETRSARYSSNALGGRKQWFQIGGSSPSVGSCEKYSDGPRLGSHVPQLPEGQTGVLDSGDRLAASANLRKTPLTGLQTNRFSRGSRIKNK